LYTDESIEIVKKKGGPGEGKEKGGIEEIVPATVH
jgi:hypothetical protein